MKDYLFSRLMAIILAFFAMSVPVAAVAETVDLGPLSPEVTYEIPEFKEVIATFTPSVTGPVKFLWSANPLTLYSGSEHSESQIVDGSHSYTQNGQLMSYSSLEAGHTYYIYSAMTIMKGTLIIREGDTELELLYTYPSLDPEAYNYYGGHFSVSKNYRIGLDFNYPVTVGNCLIIAGDERVRVTPVVSNALVSFDVNDVIMGLYRDGFIKEGDTMTLRLLQVKDALNPDNKYGGNGRLELEFVMAAKPAELIETKGYSAKVSDNPLMSYYLEGDPDAMMQLVFDRDIDAAEVPVAQISYGNPDNLDLGIYHEYIDGVVDGSVVSFDFSGKLRRRIDMIPGADVSLLPYTFFVSYANIFTSDSQMAYTGMISNPTGFTASYLINELQYTVAADFLPARGSVLSPGDSMEIWVMNGSKIVFDNISIDYVENGAAKTVEVAKSDIEAIVDPDSLGGEDMLFNFTLPEFTADNGSALTIYMAGLRCADGLDHSADVRGNFYAGSNAVGAIAADDAAPADVFDVAGNRVLRDASRADINALEKGIYIFKGRKIIVR